MKRISNEALKMYQQQVYSDSPVVTVYHQLFQVMQQMRSQLMKTTTDFKVGNISPGYLDYTYFPFFDDFLRAKKLRFGIVLNHQQMRFELWLMAQNATEQAYYWNQLKETSWNAHQPTMPQYSVLETVLENQPDFDDVARLSAEIIQKALSKVKKIYPYLR